VLGAALMGLPALLGPAEPVPTAQPAAAGDEGDAAPGTKRSTSAPPGDEDDAGAKDAGGTNGAKTGNAAAGEPGGGIPEAGRDGGTGGPAKGDAVMRELAAPLGGRGARSIGGVRWEVACRGDDGLEAAVACAAAAVAAAWKMPPSGVASKDTAGGGVPAATLSNSA